MNESLYEPLLMAAANYRYLDQHWDDRDRAWFYHVDQGSRLVPYDLFLHLEQADSPDLFRAAEYLLKFGLLPSPTTKHNAHDLPIGLTHNDFLGETFLGITCAACHTQAITYQGDALLIDGGQAMFDLQMFQVELVRALEATRADDAKGKRLAERLKKPYPEVLARLDDIIQTRRETIARNYDGSQYGFTRLDAFGAIMNKALLLTGVEGNFNPADAPINYPYLWDTPQHDYVEWNGLSQNSSVGALARNIGEVVGVFGHVIPETTTWLRYDAGYKSSIQAANLRKIEKHVATLVSPSWPDLFPPIDAELASEGSSALCRALS